MMMGPKPFEFNDNGNCALDWQNWLRGFEIFASANQILAPKLKRDWLLHFAGLKVQNIYFNLDNKSEEEEPQKCGPLITGFVPHEQDVYTETVNKLQGFFAPKRNLSYERHLFRKMKQQQNERIDTFVMKLRTQAERCEFKSNTDDNIKDQITSGCYSDSLRRKILEKDDANLESIIKIARILEAVSEQQKEFTNDTKTSDNDRNDPNEVCKIEARKKFGNRNFNRTSNISSGCARCGLTNHKSSDDKCPAMGKTCNKCGKTNHFARKCRTRNFQNTNAKVEKENEPSTKFRRESQPVQNIEPNAIKTDYEDIFCDINTANTNTIWCKIGEIETKVVVDSGSKYNIVDRIKSKRNPNNIPPKRSRYRLHRIWWTHTEVPGNVYGRYSSWKQTTNRQILRG